MYKTIMKKALSLLLIACLFLTLLSCGKNTNSGTGNDQNQDVNNGNNQTGDNDGENNDANNGNGENNGSGENNGNNSDDEAFTPVDFFETLHGSMFRLKDENGQDLGPVQREWISTDENGNLKRDDRTAVGENGVVSSASVYASQAGLAVLEAGGNAVDAAIAVSYALGVVEPQSSGIGGGGFMLIHTADGENYFIDFREVAPANQTAYTWLDENGNVLNDGKANSKGGMAVAVPGTVAGMELALSQFGSGNVSRMDIMTPAIALASRGFYVGAFQYNQTLEFYKDIINFPVISDYYLKDGAAYKPGDLFINEDMAKTLTIIAQKGADGFYKGEVAEAMLAEIAKYGGVMTQEDLDNYEVVLREPVTGTYRGYHIISSPPPSSGGTHIIQILNVLENYEIGELTVNSPMYLHLWSETLKAAFADRERYMADTDFVEGVPLEGLTSKEYAKTIADKITNVSQSWLPGDPSAYVHDSTSSFSVADKDGNIVTVTQSLECSFGSCVAVPGYGFILNDEMHDFSTDPNSVNCVQGSKHPLSSMSPTIILNPDGTPYFTLGSPGGIRIYPTVAQVISRVIDHDMTLQEAIDCARLFEYGSAEGIAVENHGPYGVTSETMSALQGMGHTVTLRGAYKIYFGGVHGVMYLEDGTLCGAADPRRDGKALGY